MACKKNQVLSFFHCESPGNMLSVEAPAADAAQERFGDPGVAMLAGDGLGGGCQHLEDGKKWKNHEKNPFGSIPQGESDSIDVLFRKWSGWWIHFPSGPVGQTEERVSRQIRWAESENQPEVQIRWGRHGRAGHGLLRRSKE